MTEHVCVCVCVCVCSKQIPWALPNVATKSMHRTTFLTELVGKPCRLGAMDWISQSQSVGGKDAMGSFIDLLQLQQNFTAKPRLVVIIFFSTQEG